MNLDRWCRDAQNDQNVLRMSHLHANYRQSLNTNLVTADGLQSFKVVLSYFDQNAELANFRLLLKSDKDGGFANFIIERAKQVFYQPRNPAKPPVPSDFRLDGKVVSYDDEEIFVNLARERFAIKRRAGGPSKLLPSPPAARAVDIMWLTRRSDVIEKLRESIPRRGRSLSEKGFFSALTALLGLKPRRLPQVRHRIDLYRVKIGNILIRPHGLSTGYPDRFCGTSPFKQFGATIDNRDGSTGLPEAIIFASNVEQIVTVDSEYVSLKKILNRFAPWIDPTSAAPIEAVLNTTEVHANDLPYSKLQPLILKRLKGNRESCGTSNLSVCVCAPGLSTGVIP